MRPNAWLCVLAAACGGPPIDADSVNAGAGSDAGGVSAPPSVSAPEDPSQPWCARWLSVTNEGVENGHEEWIFRRDGTYTARLEEWSASGGLRENSVSGGWTGSCDSPSVKGWSFVVERPWAIVADYTQAPNKVDNPDGTSWTNTSWGTCQNGAPPFSTDYTLELFVDGKARSSWQQRGQCSAAHPLSVGSQPGTWVKRQYGFDVTIALAVSYFRLKDRIGRRAYRMR